MENDRSREYGCEYVEATSVPLSPVSIMRQGVVTANSEVSQEFRQVLEERSSE